MPQATDFRYQAVTAFAGVSGGQFPPVLAIRKAVQRWPDVYDGEILGFGGLLNIPQADIPIASVMSKDGANSLDASRVSVNIRWFRKQDPGPRLDDILGTFAERLAFIYEGTEFKIGRVGTWISHLATAPDVVSQIAQRFIRPDSAPTFLGRPEGFELHVYNILSLGKGLRANYWTRIKTYRAAGQETQITVEQDINTLVEEAETRQFSKGEMHALFTDAARQFEETLKLYFPMVK